MSEGIKYESSRIFSSAKRPVDASVFISKSQKWIEIFRSNYLRSNGFLAIWVDKNELGYLSRMDKWPFRSTKSPIPSGGGKGQILPKYPSLFLST